MYYVMQACELAPIFKIVVVADVNIVEMTYLKLIMSSLRTRTAAVGRISRSTWTCAKAGWSLAYSSLSCISC
jgi:hypothetical protein